jgi:hypothetical protein
MAEPDDILEFLAEARTGRRGILEQAADAKDFRVLGFIGALPMSTAMPCHCAIR